VVVGSVHLSHAAGPNWHKDLVLSEVRPS